MRGGRGSGQIEVFKKMPEALPFSLPAVFRSLTFFAAPVLLSLLVRLFRSSTLIESLAEPTVNLNEKSRMPHCNLTWIDCKIETYKIS